MPNQRVYREYDADTKAAVMAALLTGQSVAEIAREYKINPSTVRNWKSSARLEGAIPQETKYRIGDLLVTYVEKMLEHALAAQAEQFSKATWLNTQNAADLAVLHGVCVDKTIRIIEALAGGNSNEQRPE